MDKSIYDATEKTGNNNEERKLHTERFFQTLLQMDHVWGTELTFQIMPEREGCSRKPKIFHDNLRNIGKTLFEANKGGSLVAVMVNEGDGKGRSAKNVTRVRSVYIDLDGQPLEPVLECAVPPSMVIESSPGRFHVYWIVPDCDLKAFRWIQKALAERFGADPNVCDLPRAMRIPGFDHQKGDNPFMTRVISCSTNSYPVQDICSRILGMDLQELLARNHRQKKCLTGTNAHKYSLQEIDEMLSHIPADDYDRWIRIGMAIRSEFPGQEGFALFDRWSQSSSKYIASDIEAKWNSFGSETGERQVTIASLVREAKASGYTEKQKRDYTDYIELFYSLPGIKDVRRELLTDELYILTDTGEWIPAVNMIRYAESHARSAGGFNPSDFIRHLERHRIDEKKPELLIDLPTWDQHDRILEISEAVRCKGLSSEQVYEVLRAWLVSIFRRLEDPSIQPPALIIQGPQGCGKDALVNALVGGLGSYFKDLTIDGEEAELQLHTALVFYINEFDRTSSKNVANLKRLLTTAQTNCRLKYDYRAQIRKSRAVYIATCNVEDFFRDYTGNRRFNVLHIEYGGFARLDNGRFATSPEVVYPGMFCRLNHQEERLQILAQARDLAGSGDFAPSAETSAIMNEIVDRLSPPDITEIVEEMWNEMAADSCRLIAKEWLSNSEISEKGIFRAIAAATNISETRIQHILKIRGYEYRTRTTRGYCLKNFDLQSEPERDDLIDYYPNGRPDDWS